jgi:KTSC domain
MLRGWLVLCLAVPQFQLPPAIGAEPATTPAPIISHIPRQHVESTAIAAVGYSKRQHILEIEFVSGAIYRYFDVPRAVYRELMSSESKARFYDSNIRRQYRSIPIRSRQKEQAPMKLPASAQDRNVPGHE